MKKKKDYNESIDGAGLYAHFKSINQKMGQRTKQTLLQGRHTDG